jgi:toxin-antitoxin system PIN domain toxin
MPTLCDINFLLAACYQRHAHHPAALEWLNAQDELSILICRNTQLGLLRLLCNVSVMGQDVCSLARAWAIYDEIIADERFDFSTEPEGLERFLRQFTSAGTISPKLWQDAYLAAFACSTRAHLVTFDQGFKQYKGLKLTLLTQS